MNSLLLTLVWYQLTPWLKSSTYFSLRVWKWLGQGHPRTVIFMLCFLALLRRPDLAQCLTCSALRAFTSSLEQSSPHTPDSKHTVPLSMWALMGKSLRSTAPGSPRDSREVPQDPVVRRGVAGDGMAGTQGPDSPGPPLPNSNTASLLLHCFAQWMSRNCDVQEMTPQQLNSRPEGSMQRQITSLETHLQTL